MTAGSTSHDPDPQPLGPRPSAAAAAPAAPEAATSDPRATASEARVRPVPWAAVLVTAVLAFLTFAVTLGGTFIYDDIPILLIDERVHTPGRWTEFLRGAYWSETFNTDNLYRPITSLSFVLEQRLHGGRAWAFHLVNLLLHAAVTGAVAGFTGRLWGGRAAWPAGVLFAVHPVHTEVVAGLVGRAELLCALATLVGLTLCLNRPLTGRRAAGVFGCFLVALLSKEQGMLFPLLVPLALVLPGLLRRPPAVDPAERRRLQLLGLALLWGLAGYVLFRERVLPFGWDRTLVRRDVNPAIYAQGADRWLLPVVLAGRYLVLLVAPGRLSLDYGADVIGSSVRWNEPYVYLGAGAALGWLGLTVWALQGRAWPAALCLLAFALLYGTVGNVAVHIGTILGERLMYMPSAFFLALAGAAIARAPLRAAVPLVAAVAALGAWRSVTYAALWNDKAALYAYTFENQPRSVQAHNLVFQEHAGRKDWPAALRVARRCIERVPNDPRGYMMAAEALTGLGEPDQAQAMIARAGTLGAEQWVLAHADTQVAVLREEQQQRAEAAAATRPAAPAGRGEPSAVINPPPEPATGPATIEPTMTRPVTGPTPGR